MSASTSGSERLEPVSKKAMQVASQLEVSSSRKGASFIRCKFSPDYPRNAAVQWSKIVLHKTAKSCKISEIFLHIQNSGLGSMLLYWETIAHSIPAKYEQYSIELLKVISDLWIIMMIRHVCMECPYN